MRRKFPKLRLAASGRPWFWVQVVGLLIFGLALTAVPWETADVRAALPAPDWIVGLLPKIGEAFVVAVVLVIVVDRAAKRDLLKEFARDVSVHIIGRVLPPELREHIEQYLESDFVRSKWRITYTISQWNATTPNDFERVVTLSEYEMQNRTNSPKDYTFRYEVEESSDTSIAKNIITRCSARCLSDIERENFDRTGADLKVMQKNNASVFEEIVSVPPTPGGDYLFTAESIECWRDGATMTFFASYPTLSTSVTVHFPKDRLGVVLDLSFGDVETDAARIELETGVEWILRKPILPGQGFTIRILKATIPSSLPSATVTSKAMSTPAATGPLSLGDQNSAKDLHHSGT